MLKIKIIANKQPVIRKIKEILKQMDNHRSKIVILNEKLINIPAALKILKRLVKSRYILIWVVLFFSLYLKSYFISILLFFYLILDFFNND